MTVTIKFEITKSEETMQLGKDLFNEAEVNADTDTAEIEIKGV